MQLIDSNLDYACFWPLRVGMNGGFNSRALMDENNEQTDVIKFIQFFKKLKNYRLIQSSNQWKRTKTLAAISQDEKQVIVYIICKAPWSVTMHIKDLDDDGFVARTAYANTRSAKDGNTKLNSIWSNPKVTIDINGRVNVKVPSWSLTRVIIE